MVKQGANVVPAAGARMSGTFWQGDYRKIRRAPHAEPFFGSVVRQSAFTCLSSSWCRAMPRRFLAMMMPLGSTKKLMGMELTP